MRWASGPGQPPARFVAPPPPPKKGWGCFRVVMVLMVGSFLLCCCLVSAVAESTDDPLDWDHVNKVVPADVGPKTSLGVALVPEDLSPSLARHFAWRQRLDAWELGYGVSGDVHQQVEDDFAALGSRFHYTSGAGNAFTWSPPASCLRHEWECVFEALAHDNAEDLAPLSALFRRKQQQEQLDAREVTELVVGFVQNIKYRLPTEDTAAFGMLPPAIVVADGSGDCDSKALLAVVLLKQLGVDAVVLLASGLGHAALGVALPVTGKKFGGRGQTKYAFVEVTAPGWALGAVPPEYDVANAWKVIPVVMP